MLVALPTVSVAIWSPVGWKHHEAPWGEYYNSIPSSHGWERYWKQAWGPAQWELILVGRTTKHHGVNITTPPLPPWMGEVLKTSERACTVRAYLGWKHHGVNITTPPHHPMDGRGIIMSLKQARGHAQWELILVGSTMKHHGVNITTPPHHPMNERGICP